MKSHTQHIKKMYNRKQTFMSISFSINTQRTTQTMNLNQILLLIQISVHGCSYTVLCMLLLLLLQNYVTMHNEGVYIPFPSCALKQSNLELNFYLPTLTTINASIYFRQERGARGLITLYQGAFIKWSHLYLAYQLQGKIQKFGWVCPVVLCLPRWLAWCEGCSCIKMFDV